jgi:hypothetical protein
MILPSNVGENILFLHLLLQNLLLVKKETIPFKFTNVHHVGFFTLAIQQQSLET